jgi:hypothetical protein
MAAREVIHFPCGAQLSTRFNCPARIPPEPVAESPPKLKSRQSFAHYGRILDQSRFKRQRAVWENTNTKPNRK